MNAGLPGTGIGGLFYIASALWMPVHRALHGRVHDGHDWRRVFAQGMIAGGILWALAATGSLLAHLIAPVVSLVAPGEGAIAAQQVRELVRWVALIGTAGLLLSVLIIVELMRFVVRRRPLDVRARTAALRLDEPVQLPDVA